MMIRSFSIWPYNHHYVTTCYRHHIIAQSHYLKNLYKFSCFSTNFPNNYFQLYTYNYRIIFIFNQKQKGLPYNETEAFLVCYSITDRESFEYAVEAVQSIRQRSDAALILVANKSDLVRSRKVGFEGILYYYCFPKFY